MTGAAGSSTHAIAARDRVLMVMWRVPPKRPRTPPPSRDVIRPLIKPLIKPLLKPVVEPVLARLDRHEGLLREMKEALDVQFKRTAAVQAQLDQILAAIAKARP